MARVGKDDEKDLKSTAKPTTVKVTTPKTETPKETAKPTKSLSAKDTVSSSAKKTTPSVSDVRTEKLASKGSQTAQATINSAPKVDNGKYGKYQSTGSPKKTDYFGNRSVENYLTPTNGGVRNANGNVQKEQFLTPAQKARYNVSNNVAKLYEKGNQRLMDDNYKGYTDLTKGVINRVRSAAGSGIESAGNAVKDILGMPTKKDAETEAIANKATEQFGRAEDKAQTKLGKDAVKVADSLATMGSYALLPFGANTTGLAANTAAKAGAAASKYVAQKGLGKVLQSGLLSAYMGAGTFGDEYVKSRESGADKLEATTRALPKGIISYLTESMGGIGGSPFAKTANNFLEKTAAHNFFTNVLYNAAEEGGEEMVEYVGDYLTDVLNDMVYKKQIQTDFDAKEMMENAKIGALSGGVFGTVASVGIPMNGKIDMETAAKDMVSAIAETQAEKKAKSDPTTLSDNVSAQLNQVNQTEANGVETAENGANVNVGSTANNAENVNADARYAKDQTVYNSVNNTTMSSDESRADFKENPRVHMIEGDAEVGAQANAYMHELSKDKGLVGVIDNYERKNANKYVPSATDVITVGETLAEYTSQIADAKARGDLETVNKLAKEQIKLTALLDSWGHEGGLVLEKLAQLNRMFGDSIKVDRNSREYIGNMIDELTRKYGKSFTVDANLLAEAEATQTDRAWDRVRQNIINQEPISFFDKFRTWAYLSMLSNPATHVRNMVSTATMALNFALSRGGKAFAESTFNALADKASTKYRMQGEELMAEAETISDEWLKNRKISEANDKLAKAKQVDLMKQKTAAWGWSSADVRQFASSDKLYNEAEKNFSTYGKYNENAQERTNLFGKTDIRMPEQLADIVRSKLINSDNADLVKVVDSLIDGGVLSGWAEFNSYMLSAEDKVFKKWIFSQSVAQYITANKIDVNNITDEQIAKAEMFAFSDALYYTFNQNSDLASALSKAESKSAVMKILGQAVMPFKKVPINIVEAGKNLTPIGVAQGVINLYNALSGKNKGKTITGKNVDVNAELNRIGQGLSGTAVMALGAALWSLGWIDLGSDDEDDNAVLDNLEGRQNFSIKIPGVGSYTIDFLGSTVMPLFMGAVIAKQSNAEKADDIPTVINNTISTISKVADPAIEMSMLQNIEQLLTNSYTGGLGSFLLDSAGDLVNQLIPQVLASFTRGYDNSKRDAYTVDKTDSIPDIIETPIKSVMSKIPGLSETLPEKYDYLGRKQTYVDENIPTALRVLYQNWSPGKFKANTSTEVTDFLQQLVKNNPEDAKALTPSGMSEKKIKLNGENQDISVETKNEITKNIGEIQNSMLEELIADKDFQSLNEAEQIDMIKDIYTYAKTRGKQEVFEGYTDNKSWYDQFDAYKDEGMSTLEALKLRGLVNDSGNKEETIDALKKNGMSDFEALNTYNKSKNVRSVDGDTYKGFSDKQIGKVKTLQGLGYSDNLISAAATAVVGMDNIGYKKSYVNVEKLLTELGITSDTRFISDFYNKYMLN